MLKLATLLFAESAAYRNCPLASMASPATVAPELRHCGGVEPCPSAQKGEPATSVKAPPVPIEKAEMLPDTPFETYKKPAVGEIARNCGFGALTDVNVNGDPATGVNNPRVVSMLKTEIDAGTTGTVDPWLSTTRNWPPELMATPIGLTHTAGSAQTDVGGSAVPIGVRTPLTWSTVKPE